MGNSEVGHLNLGAGRPVLQDLPRIDAAIADGSFFDATGARRRLRPGRPSPAAGCTSSASIGPGGVHANDRHLVALVELAARRGVADGPGPRAARRPRHAAALGPRLRRATSRAGSPRPTPTPGSRRSAVATSRWIATSAGSGSARGYDAIVHGVGEHAPSADRRDRGRLRPRRERRVRPARRSSTASTAGSGTATRSSTPTSGPTGPGS